MTKEEYIQSRKLELSKHYRHTSTSDDDWKKITTMECGDFPQFSSNTSYEITLKMLLECRYSKAQIVAKLNELFPGNKNDIRPQRVIAVFSNGKCRNIIPYKKDIIIGLKWDRHKFFTASGKWKGESKSIRSKAPANDKKYLIDISTEIAEVLSSRGYNKFISLRNPENFVPLDYHTDGWMIEFGKLKMKNIKLHLWFDRWSEHSERKLWYGVYSNNPEIIKNISKSCSLTLGKAFELSDSNLDSNNRLNSIIPVENFNSPYIEIYKKDRSNFYGFYEYHSKTLTGKKYQDLIKRIISFYETLLEKMERVNVDEKDIYPQVENRTVVISHTKRERSHYLATRRKIIDNYICSICEFNFEEIYGLLGKEFAEVHHIIPLSKLKPNVFTRIEDLITVCPNCHRMLHRMKGEKSDIDKLRQILKHRNIL